MYLPHLHYCCACGEDLGAENGDGICPACEETICDDCGCVPDEPAEHDCECACHEAVEAHR